MEYEIKIVRKGETASEKMDAIVENVSERFRKELAKLLAREEVCNGNHVWKHGGDVFYYCENCNITKKPYHRDLP